jgi:hypothetical protein
MSSRANRPSPGEVLENREKECFNFLRQIPRGSKYVLIGGYAVSSFQFPRYSVDLDFVLEDAELLRFRRMAEASGFKLKSEKLLGDKHNGRYVTYVKNIGVVVTLDFMVNLVVSRQTSFAYPYSYIKENSEVRLVRGRSLDAKAEARVADREMLLALKANAMRQQDMRDILALCYGKVDYAKAASHLRNCPRDSMLKNLESLTKFLSTSDPQGFRSIFGISAPLQRRSLDNCSRLIAAIRKAVQPDENHIRQ